MIVIIGKQNENVLTISEDPHENHVIYRCIRRLSEKAINLFTWF